MGLQETDLDGDLWQFTGHDSRKITHIAANSQVNVTVAAPVSATRSALPPPATGTPRTDAWPA
jgi:general stress protein 26